MKKLLLILPFLCLLCSCEPNEPKNEPEEEAEKGAEETITINFEDVSIEDNIYSGRHFWNFVKKYIEI